MKNTNKTKQQRIMSMRDVQVLLSQQMETLKTSNKQPSSAVVSAANAQANLVGKYMSTIKLTMEYAKMTGGKPDLGFLKMSNGSAGTDAVAKV